MFQEPHFLQAGKALQANVALPRVHGCSMPKWKDYEIIFEQISRNKFARGFCMVLSVKTHPTLAFILINLRMETMQINMGCHVLAADARHILRGWNSVC